MVLFQSQATSAAWLKPVFLIDYIGECIHEALNVYTALQVLLRPNQSGGCRQRWLEAFYAMKLGHVDLPTKGAPFFLPILGCMSWCCEAFALYCIKSTCLRASTFLLR